MKGEDFAVSPLEHFHAVRADYRNAPAERATDGQHAVGGDARAGEPPDGGELKERFQEAHRFPSRPAIEELGRVVERIECRRSSPPRGRGTSKNLPNHVGGPAAHIEAARLR